jgi:hypothetical protein
MEAVRTELQLRTTHMQLFKFRSQPYPDVHACIGNPVGRFHEREWWHATGKAREDFKTIEEQLLEQLRAAFHDTYCSIVHFHLFMIGRAQSTAKPTIMFFCEEKEPRKRAKRILDEGGLLNQLPGFRTGHQARQPGIGRLIRPATGSKAENNSDHPSGHPIMHFEAYYDPSYEVRALGMPIFIKGSQGGLRRATAYRVFHQDRCFLMSVAHVFAEDSHNKADSSTDEDSDFDLGSDTESEEEAGNQVRIGSLRDMSLQTASPGHYVFSTRGRLISEDEGSQPSSSTFVEKSTENGMLTQLKNVSLDEIKKDDQAEAIQGGNRDETSHRLEKTKTSQRDEMTRKRMGIFSDSIQSSQPERIELIGKVCRFSIDQDWALIAVDHQELSLELIEDRSIPMDSLPTQHANNATAMAFIAGRSIGNRGRLSEASTHILFPGSNIFQEVFHVVLDEAISWGDCGSLVADFTAKELYGHIVASSEDRRYAFVIPTATVLSSLNTTWTATVPNNLKLWATECKWEGPYKRKMTSKSQENSVPHQATEMDSSDLVLKKVGLGFTIPTVRTDTPSGSNTGHHRTTPENGTTGSDAYGVPYFFRIDEIAEHPDAYCHADKQGNWKPSVEHGANVNYTAGVGVSGKHWFCNGRVIEEITHPVNPSPQPYKTYSVYYIGGVGFSVLKGDARHPPVDEGWHPLQFAYYNENGCSSYLTNSGQSQTLRLQPQNSGWADMLLPSTNHSHQKAKNMLEGGIIGELPIFLALMAFTTSRENLADVLPRMYANGRWVEGHEWETTSE